MKKTKSLFQKNKYPNKSFITICGILIIHLLGLTILEGQSDASLSNIIIEGDYHDKNMHNLLMDVNTDGPIYIAYDVDQFKQIKINSSPNGLHLNTIFDLIFEPNSYEISSQSDRTYLLRYKNNTLKDLSSTIKDNQVLEGLVLNKNGEPLPYAYVVTEDLKIGTYADSLGRYKLNIPIDTRTIKLCAGNLGYKNNCYNVIIDKDQQDFILNEDPKLIEALTIIDMAIPFKIEENSFSIKMNRRFNTTSTAVNDPLKKAALSASVHSDNDLSAEIQIRNAQADETAIMYDNIPLFASYHYNGFISNINPLTVNEISIYPCYTPAEYNNKSAGLVYIRSTENATEGMSGTLGVNFLYATGMLQYRTTHQIFQIAGRSNIRAISNQSFYNLSIQNDNTIINPDGSVKEIILINPLYKFGDFNLKYQWKINHNWKLKILHLQSRDNTSSSLEFDFKPKNKRDTIFKRTQTESEIIHSIGSSIQIDGRLTKKWDMSFSIVRSNLMFENEASYIIKNITRKPPKRSPLVFDIFNQVDWQEAKLKFNYNDSKYGLLELGYSLNRYSTNIKYQFEDHLIINNIIEKQEHHLFSSWNKIFLTHYELNFATNIKIENTTNPIQFSPRLSLSRKISKHAKISLEYGNYQQQLRKITHENPQGKSFDFWTISRGDTIPSINSKQLELGMDYKLSNLFIQSHIFYRNSDGELSWIAQDPRRPKRINPNNPRPRPKYIYYVGKSKSYGLESMIYYQFNPFQAMISYQLSEALVSYDKIRKGEWQASDNDRRHRFTGILNYQFRKWTLEATYNFISGKPYLDILKIPRGTNREDIKYEELYSLLPDYQRFDLGITYNFKVRNTNITASFEINNVFDHTNTDYREFYSNDSNSSISGTSYNQMERFYNVGVELQF